MQIMGEQTLKNLAMNEISDLYNRKGISSDALIHPTAIIGKNNYIGAGTKIGQGVRIGDNNYIGPDCIIGDIPESREYLSDIKHHGTVIIGDGNKIMKQVTIDAGTEIDTVINDNNLLLKNAHVGHDATLGSHITLTCNVVIGGHAFISDGCNIGLQSVVNPRANIPSDVRIGALSLVRKGLILKSGYIYAGNPLRQIKVWKQ